MATTVIDQITTLLSLIISKTWKKNWYGEDNIKENELYQNMGWDNK